MMVIDRLSHHMFMKYTVMPSSCTAVKNQRSVAEFFILHQPLKCLPKLKLMHPKLQLLTIKALNKGSAMFQFVNRVVQT